MSKGEDIYFLRDEVGAYMTTVGRMNHRVIVVNADLAGTCRNREFAKMYPDREFNVGIAEQNAVSFAAGLAHEGFIPFVFSMAPFISMRACEQCRTDVAYASLPVRLIGVYAGVSGGISGATHWSVEDCGIMTAIPGMTVLEPCDKYEAERLLDKCIEFDGPVYMRVSVEPVTNKYSEGTEISIGGSNEVISGNDATILCSGITVQNAIEASKILHRTKGINARVVDMYSLKPIDRFAIINAAKTGYILVVQDHNVIGGLGSIVATVIAEEGLSVKFRILGLNDSFLPMAHANYLYKTIGIDSVGIANMIDKMMC